MSKTEESINHQEWSGSPSPEDPDNWWVDDENGDYINASTGERIGGPDARALLAKAEG